MKQNRSIDSNINLSEMKEDQKFDLRKIIQALTSSPNPYTEITLITISPVLLHFKVSKALSAKTKAYKIICKPQQAISQAQIICQSLHKFALKKLSLSEDVFIQHDSKDYLDDKQLSSLFDNILFDQLILDELIKEPQRMFEIVLEKFKTNKITVMHPLPLRKVASITQRLHEKGLSTPLILYFQIESLALEDLLDFAQKWVRSIPPKFFQDSGQEQKFGYPFPRLAKKHLYTGRRQQISLTMRNKQILTARELEQQGRFFVLSGQHSLSLLTDLLHILFAQNKGISLQIGPLQGQQLVHLSEFTTRNFERGYKLVVAHQLELSPSRLVLNTLDLTYDQVERMMRIAAEPGRYEICLYSELNYFQMAVGLFLSKPLLKFNFFLPLEQWTPETQALIQKIEKHCKATKLSFYSFAALLNRYAHLGYVFTNSVFHSLTLEQ